jgi:hypothetical protein
VKILKAKCTKSVSMRATFSISLTVLLSCLIRSAMKTKLFLGLISHCVMDVYRSGDVCVRACVRVCM